MIDPRACSRENIKEGLHVLYSIDKNENEDRWMSGIVKRIETPKGTTFEEFGIKIRAVDGTIGYVKKILDEEDLSEDIILNLIEKGEKQKVEFKETFKVASNNNTELKCLRDSCVKEIAAFMNTSGGTLFIGIHDSKNITGLAPDYAFITLARSTQTKDDKLKQEIRSYVSEQLKDPTLESYYNIDIRTIRNKEICIIQVTPSPKPVFVDQDIFYTKCGENKQTVGKKQVFYYRTDSGVKELDPRKILEYLSMRGKK